MTDKMYENYSKIRDKNEMKDIDVAKATSIAASSLSDWKSNRSNIKIDKLIKIAELLKVDINDILYGDDKPDYLKEMDQPAAPSELSPPAAPDAADNTRYPNRYDTLVEIASELNDKGLIALEGNARLLASMPEYKEKGVKMA